MGNIRVIRANLDIEFQKVGEKEEIFKREFDKLSEVDDDSIGHWLKLAKARGETRESDQVLLTLITELHRKVDELTKLMKNEVPKKEKLGVKTNIDKRQCLRNLVDPEISLHIFNHAMNIAKEESIKPGLLF